MIVYDLPLEKIDKMLNDSYIALVKSYFGEYTSRQR